MSASESHEGRLVPQTTGGPNSDPQRPLSPVSGGIQPEPRIVTCQYRQDPHPLDDECVNVTDVPADDALEAGLNRILAAVNGYPPKPAVHDSHQPEAPGTEMLPGHTSCKVCCRFVAYRGCASPRGVAPCAGPGRIVLREDV